jgi:TatD DNase family protein
MLCCGTQESDWDAVAALAQRYPQIIPAFGLHPWFIATRSDSWFETLERMLCAFPGAAVGEIGLDHAGEERNDGDQLAVFTMQISLARKLHRPASIHCRKAWGAMLTTLTAQGGLPLGGVIHAYSGPPDLMGPLTRLNVSISFSGSVVNPRSKRAHACAKAADERYLLTETDAPDIPLPGVAPGENEPAKVREVAQALAELRGSAVERIAEITDANARRLFLPRG